MSTPWSRTSEAVANVPWREGRVIEMLAVILLGIATVGSAWCGYQASRWNGEQEDQARASAVAQVEASRLFALGTQRVAYDATIAAQYAQAVAQGNTRLRDFYKQNLIRPEFLPVIAQWETEAASGSGQATNLFENDDYIAAQIAPYEKAQTVVSDRTKLAQEAGTNADDYVLTTLIMASALFFAGVTSTFRTRFVQLLLLAAAAVVIAIAAGRIIDLPVA